MSGLNEWLSYPTGPTVRHILAIGDEEYAGHKAPKPSDEEKERFELFLKERLSQAGPFSKDELVQLIEELTGMGMSALVLSLRDLQPDLELADDFRAMLGLGAAAMLEAEYETAIAYMQAAHGLEPDEFAPYINLAKICHYRFDDAGADQWAQAGLKLDPNHQELWEILAAAAISSADRETAHQRLYALAKGLSSYAGLSLAADIVADPLLKAQYLTDHYRSGGREGAFLVEYTGTLGQASQFEKIPQVLWEAENLPQFQGEVPHELYLHAIQAYLSLESHDNALKMINKLNSKPALPPHIQRDLEQLQAALDEPPHHHH